MPPRGKKPQPIPADNGGWIRDLPKPSRRKKQQEPVLFEIPKGSSLAEMFLAGREQRHPPVAITEQQAPDRTADSNSASITQTSADQHADNSPSSQLHGLLQNQPEYCSTCKEEVTVEFAEEAADLVCCSQCGKVLRVLPIDDSSDNAPGPGPSEDRGRDRSENDSNSDRDDCKRQAVAPDSSDDMVLEPSEISPKTAGAASTADTADRIAADANQATPIADKERLQCELQSLNALIPQLVARKATLEAQLSASEAETASPPSANTQSQPAMQAEPSMQTKQTEPARQPPTDTGHSASTAPPAQPRTFRPPKQPRVAAPHGGRASYAAVAAGAAAGAAAAAAAAGAHAPKPPRKSSSTVTGGRPQAAAPPSSFASTFHVRTHFVFKAPQGTLPDIAASLKDRLTAFLQARLPGAHLPVTDAVLFGSQATSTKVFFTLGSLEAADELVGLRSALKGSGASIQDFLTPEELKIKRALWPRFIEAKARGQRAQFHRARLVVS